MNNVIESLDIKSDLFTLFKKNAFSSISVLVDENTERFCYPYVQDSIPAHDVIVIKSGEEHKNLETCVTIWERMTNLKMDRHSLLINLGGGVIGDMGGFCASTYKRGIKFIQIPTTLLSQVDASIGGKLGIDFKQYKNHIGVFKDAESVIINTFFLNTLDRLEIRSGFAEIAKHCLIADKYMWDQIKKKSLNEQDLKKLVPHSIQIKSKVVEADPYEKDIRKLLNFGHTIGHAIESFYLEIPDKKLLHGEAIAIGMICESYISKAINLITQQELDEIQTFFISVYPAPKIPAEEFDQIVFLTQQDKKNKSGAIQAALLDGIGKCKINVGLTPELIKESLNYYNSLI